MCAVIFRSFLEPNLEPNFIPNISNDRTHLDQAGNIWRKLSIGKVNCQKALYLCCDLVFKQNRYYGCAS